MIVLTAPTGQIGRQLLARLLADGAPVRVIARDPSRVPDGVDVVAGSHGDPEVVDKAFAGAESVFWLPPTDPRAARGDHCLEFAEPASEAFVSHGVRRVVGVSALGRGATQNAGLVSASHAVDDLIASTGVHYRALTMPTFMDNWLRQVQSIRDGVISAPVSGDRKAPTCATRDIAAVAARLLLDDTWTGRGDVPVLGPEDLSCNDIARIMTDVLGWPVRFEQVSMTAFRAGLTGNGMSDAVAQAMVDMMVAKENGLDNAEPRTPEATTPTTFRTWCEDVLKPAVLT